ncbi:MAG: hypothetical protein K2N95_07360 [Lachnospiraceae bacterium]|nr:hypothetical protein [Lachnospiraceae bacterium]
MRRNRIPHEKNRRNKIWASTVIVLILLASVCGIIIRLMEDIPTMEDIYFQAYDNQTMETVIYKYDADTEKVYEVGKVGGYFHNCKIDSGKKHITGVRSPWYPEEVYDAESGLESGIVRYSLEDGTSVLLRGEQQMRIGNKENIVWDCSFPFDGGEKMLMCYGDEELQYLLYDLKTNNAKKIDVPKMNRGVCDIRKSNIWYPMRNGVMQYNVKTNEIKEYLQDASQCSVSDDGRKTAYFGDHAKRIFLYDAVCKKNLCILRAGWNKTFGSISPYSCGWDQSGNYFCYVEHFNKFFGSSDTRIKVYNLSTKTSKCIYLQRNAPATITYEFIRNADEIGFQDNFIQSAESDNLDVRTGKGGFFKQSFRRNYH